MPPPNSYNLSNLGRNDSAENIFFARELEQVRAQSYDIKYAQRKARMLVPVDHSIDTGTDAVTYNQYDSVGVARILASYAEDLPRADVKGKQFQLAIKGLGQSYGYSLQEIRAASRVGKPLDVKKATAARKGIEDLIDKIGALGDTATGLVGLLTVPNAQTYTIPAGAGGQTRWNFGATKKTGLEVLADLTGSVATVVTTTKEAELPDTVALPVDSYGYISTTPLQTGSDTTILKHFLANNPYIKDVVPWEKCTGAGSGATNRMVVYRRDPDALCLVIPQEFESLPPEPEGLNFVISCHARCGGLQVFYPLSILYADGI